MSASQRDYRRREQKEHDQNGQRYSGGGICVGYQHLNM